MSANQTRTTFSRKTVAIAVASAVAIGGVQLTAPVNGVFAAATASAAELAPSVVTKTELVSDKSGKNVLGTTVEATEEAYKAFYDKHGHKFKLKLDFKVPDSAQPGDVFRIRASKTLFDVKGTVTASTNEGRKVGSLDVAHSDAIFTVSDDVKDSINRMASFEIPVTLDESHLESTLNKESAGKERPYEIKFSTAENSPLIFKQVLVYKDEEEVVSNHADKPLYGSSWKTVDLNTGVTYNDSATQIGNADIILTDTGSNKESSYDNKYALDSEAKTNRNVTIRYHLDDSAGRLFPTPEAMNQFVYEFSPQGLNKTFEPATANDKKIRLYKPVEDTQFKVSHKQVDDQTVDVTVYNVPPQNSILLTYAVRAESPYSPGKEVTMTSTFTNGVGEPHTSYDQDYAETSSQTYTHPSFEGYGSADDIKRNVTMSAKVNGQEADNVNNAQQVTDGKAEFSIDLKNNGNIGAGSATIKYPKGVTGPNGETEKFIDFGDEGFPAGSTKTLDLGELNVPEGDNENTFTVTMTGYPELTDPAWTTTGPTDIYVDNVKEDGNGNYIITNNDGEQWTIDLSDLRNHIKELEDKDSPSKKDVDKVKDDLNKAKEDIDKLKGADEKINGEIDKIKDAVDGLDGRVDKLEDRVDDLENAGIKEVRDNGDGTYTLIRNNGDEVKGVIDTSGSVTNIASDGKGNLIVTIDGKDQTVPLDKVKVTESNKGKSNHTVTIATPDGKSVTLDAFDNYVESITKQNNGDYLVKRNDGTEWTIKLSDLKKNIKDLKGKDAAQDKRLDDLYKRANDADKDLNDLADRVSRNEGTIEDHRKSINDINREVGDINNEIGDIKDELIRLDGQDVKEIRDNGDGTYTLIRNDGSEVKGAIGDGQDIKEIKPNNDGTFTIVHKDGSTTKVNLTQVTITEKNQGTPEHTVSITSPNGDNVTFNVFDVYVESITKQPNGDYLVTRNDGTEWTIVLSDLRDRIAALEAKDSPTRAEFDAVKKDIDALNKDIDGLKAADKVIKADIADIKSDITNLDDRVTKVEGRLTVVEDNSDALATCIAGTSLAGIPALLSLPLMLMTQLNVPGVKEANTQIQQQIGIFDENLAQQWERNGGVLQAGAVLAGLAGIIGSIAYVANECTPMMDTPAGKETDLGQLSSKVNKTQTNA